MPPPTELARHPGKAVATSSVTRHALLFMAALLLLLFVVASVGLVQIALQQNKRATQQSLFYVDKAIQAREKSMLATLSDYAYWGEAYQNLHVTVDHEWAYVRQNLGPSLFEDFAYEGVFVLDPQGRTAYAVVNGQRVAVALAQWLKQDIAELLEQARGQTEDEEPVVGFVQVDGQPALLAVTGLTTGGDPQVDALAGPPSLLLFVDLLSPAKLQALGEDFGVTNLRLATDPVDAQATPALALASVGAQPLLLRWEPAQPGRQLLYWILPLLALGGTIFALITWMTLRRAIASAREVDASYASLYASQQALAASEVRFRDVAEAATDWIWEADAELRLTYLSTRFQALTGHAASAWLGHPLDELMQCPGGLDAWLETFSSSATVSHSRQCHYRACDGELRTCHLSLRRIADGQAAGGYRGTVSDITEELQAQARIEHLLLHDALTGLPNRHRMQEFLEAKLKALPSAAKPLVMLSIDLDRFKPVNDSFGHEVGDQVLAEVSQRLRLALHEGDLVARMGNDEFILIVSGISAAEEVEQLCVGLIGAIEQPFEIDNQRIFLGASIGVAMAPTDTCQADELLRFAEIALYQAKGAGRSAWCFYANAMNERVIERRQLENDLRHALANEDLRLVLQPRYSVSGLRMVAAEALVRWQHPQRGLLGPDSFIAIAESTGLIIPLSAWVLRAACREALSWSEALIVSVNLSPVEFRGGQLVAQIRSALEETGLPPGRLELELTESVMLEDAEGALVLMQELKGLGVRLSMDDFGTGYSSLSYLRAFPFDGLKIDRSFMTDLHAADDSKAIIQAIIGLGHALSLTVTAEGVETQEQLELLRQYGCDEAQGYLLNRPMPPEELRLLL